MKSVGVSVIPPCPSFPWFFFVRSSFFVRPQKWEDSQVGLRGSNASGRRIVLLPGVFWAHGASKMAILGASFLLCILQCFRVWEGMLPPGACRMSHASARRIVSCRGLCVSSLRCQIPLAPAPTFGAFRLFFLLRRFSFFVERFLFFSWESWGTVGIKNPSLFWCSSLHYQKKGQGGWPRNRTGARNRNCRNRFSRNWEPEPPQPFVRNRNRCPSAKTLLKYWESLSPEEPN